MPFSPSGTGKFIFIKGFLIPLPYLVATTFKGIDKIDWIYILNNGLSHLVKVIAIFCFKPASAGLETNLDSLLGSLLIILNKEDWKSIELATSAFALTINY